MSLTFLIAIAALWLISPIILLVALIIAQRHVRELRESIRAQGTVEPRAVASAPQRFTMELGSGQARYAPTDLENLLLLRLELQRLGDSGALPPERQKRLLSELDGLWARHLGEGGAEPENHAWQQRRSLAWSLLAHSANRPPGPPPWSSVSPDPAVLSDAVSTPPPPLPDRLAPAIPSHSIPFSLDKVASEPKSPESPAVAPLPYADTGWERVEGAPPAPTSQAAATLQPPRAATRSPGPDEASDWHPAPPNPLEKALHAISGWPKLIAPFLAQNIGWFIGGFCFIAGALFLIANTSGFINGLVVFTSLFGASAFLLWAGYQFRQRRPDLLIASTMLLTLSVLLAPLVLAVAVRLVMTSEGEPLLLAISLPIVAATLAAFAWAVALSSALVDRSLQGRYARLLTALTAIQLAAPIAGWAPDWRGLAVLHTLLLGLLGYGLWAFAGEWLRRLFIDRRMISYYAAGMLVYTALISFVHLTWLWPESLPAGYAGPFLMALCGLLFPLDAALKEWVNKYAFLSRFSFALYALSAVAVAVALQAMPATLLTLGMGAVLYGWITWRYRTLPPLYLLFGCLAGLYGFGLLHFLPPAWQGLAGLPGVLALWGCSRWAASRAPTIALQCLLVLAVLLVGLTAWSLMWTASSWLGSVTAGLAALLGYSAVRQALQLPQADPRWAAADAGVVVLATAAVASMPSGTGPGWGMQTAFGLLGLALLWAVLGLQHRQPAVISRRIFISSALISVGIALALGGLLRWPEFLGQFDLILLLVSAGGLLLWLSFATQRQAVFYGVLGCAAGAGLLIKHSYFPGLSSGLNEFILVLAIWSLLGWLGWRLRLRQALLGDMPIPPRSISGFGLLIRPPLEQAMVLLWVIGLGQVLLRLLDGTLSARWPVSVGLGILTGLLLIGYFHRFRWVALPFFLGLAGLSVELLHFGFSAPWTMAIAVLYALLVWRLGIKLLAHPATGRWVQRLGFSVTGGAGGHQQVKESLHISAQGVAVVPVAFSVVLMLLGAYTPDWLPAVMLSLLWWLLAGWHYRSASHAYAALLTGVVGAWLAGAVLVTPALPILGQPLLNGVLSLSMAVLLIALEKQRLAPFTYWRTPVQVSSTLLYGMTLAGAVPGFLVGDSRVPGLLVLLGIALFPVARPWPNAAIWRGLGLPILLGAGIWSLAISLGISTPEVAGIAIIGGYALWLGGNVLLPRWNTRWPDWAVAPDFWPLLGVVCVLGGGAIGFLSGAFSLTIALAALTPYLFLLLRNTAWPGMAWLAVATLTLCILSASGWIRGRGWNHAEELSALLGQFALILLALNLLFRLLPLWRRYGARVAHALGWRSIGLEAPLFCLPFAVLLLVLVSLGWLEIGLLWSSHLPLQPRPWMLTGVALLLVITAGHALTIRLENLPAQVALLALQATVVAVFLNLTLDPAWLPLAVALWNGVLLLAWRYGDRWSSVWQGALEFWLALLPTISITLLWSIAHIGWGSVTATLLVVAAVTLTQGWWQGQSFRLKVGLALALAASYTLWLAGTGPTGIAAPLDGMALRNLAPWYALQSVLLLLASRIAQPRLEHWLNHVGLQNDEARLQQAYEGAEMLRALSTWLFLLSLLWLGLHAGTVFLDALGWGSTPWHFGPVADALAMSAALSLLAVQSGITAWRQPDDPNAIYTTALWLGLLAAYGRLVLWGLAPFGVPDTTALLVAAYALFLLHQFTGLRPLYHLALLLPLLALVTVPWQLASPWTGGTLLAAAVLYLSLAGTLRNPLPLYLGILALNGAIYLWAPLWAEHYGLWQFYIVPAAVSVLALLHLHRRELRPNVLSGARLAALSALYAGAGLDVFLRPELWVFVLALGLALIGIVLGIALRVRAFLYAGIAFLVLNVAGQLLRFYPEHAMSRALILLGLGTVITVGMVLFNLKREAILQRIRIARADLAAWE